MRFEVAFLLVFAECCFFLSNLFVATNKSVETKRKERKGGQCLFAFVFIERGGEYRSDSTVVEYSRMLLRARWLQPADSERTNIFFLSFPTTCRFSFFLTDKKKEKGRFYCLFFITFFGCYA